MFNGEKDLFVYITFCSTHATFYIKEYSFWGSEYSFWGSEYWGSEYSFWGSEYSFWGSEYSFWGSEYSFWASPELAPEAGDLPGHGVGRLADVVQVSLQLPAVGVGAGHFLLRLLQLTLQLTHASVELIGLEEEPGVRVRWRYGLGVRGQGTVEVPVRVRG